VSQDYSTIAEQPATRLNPEQWLRICHRYHLAGELAANRRVLEVACGAGAGLAQLGHRARQLVAVDYSLPVLQQARAHYGPQMALAGSDAERLPFPTHSFDAIFCFEAIYYLADYRRFVRECQRVLTPNGALLLSFSNPDWPYFAPGPLSSYYPPLQEVGGALAAVGFVDVRAWGILPASAATATERLRAGARRLVLAWLPNFGNGRAARLLMPFLYRGQRLLPPALSQDAIAAAAATPTTGLDWTCTDRTHRVLYVQATAPAAGRLNGAAH